VFVDIPVDESLRSADDRWRGKDTDPVTGVTTYAKPGVESTNRFVPPVYINKSRIPGSTTTKNLVAFQEASHLFDDWSIVDHSGIGETPRNPKGTIRHGTGRAELAVRARMVFAGTSVGARRAWDVIGRGPHGGAAADAASRADIVVGDHAVSVAPAAAPALIEDLGTRPAPSDLTKVHIVGHPNLFAAVARNNLRRVDMPQIPTARLGDFDRYLHERGITTKLDRVDPATLSATQNELDGRKTGQMMTKLRSGTMVGAEHPLWISSDNKLLDGHHRWAAEAALSVGEAPRTVTVVRASVPMSQLIEHARAFGRAEDIDTKHHGFSTVHSSLDERLAWFTSEGARKAWITRRKGMPDAPDADHEPAPHETPPPGTGPGNGLPTADEFEAMEHTGGPLGSQGGGWYRDTNGQRYLVKPAQSETHAHNELAASLVLGALNVPGDQTGIFAKGSKWYIAKKAIQGPGGKLGKIVGSDMTPELQRQARDGFGADTVMSSWDAFGLVGDNVITEGGVLHRIDVGGSLAFRAQGGDKPSFNPGKPWVEPTTLRTSNQGKQLYGAMTDAEAASQLEKLNSLDIDALDRRLGEAGIIPAVRTRTIDTIRDRIDNQLPGIVDELRHG